MAGTNSGSASLVRCRRCLHTYPCACVCVHPSLCVCVCVWSASVLQRPVRVEAPPPPGVTVTEATTAGVLALCGVPVDITATLATVEPRKDYTAARATHERLYGAMVTHW